MPNYTFPSVPEEGLFDRVVELARGAEAADFDLVTVMDHFYQIPGVGPEENAMLESYSTLAALAASTSRIKLGTLVTGVTYRNPALLAKTVTTLDVISKGRAVLGLGAAWNEAEHIGYGFEFPPIGERMDRLDEALNHRPPKTLPDPWSHAYCCQRSCQNLPRPERDTTFGDCGPDRYQIWCTQPYTIRTF
jgi:alkanesulfonate monooxygenase SsuD/methylene tetrahydromethanopterin reductase-like flavin-dependent oxidoreductase (luciferase family)